jgi:hypothetical protein
MGKSRYPEQEVQYSKPAISFENAPFVGYLNDLGEVSPNGGLPQNIAIGFVGEPVPFGIGNDAAVWANCPLPHAEAQVMAIIITRGHAGLKK